MPTLDDGVLDQVFLSARTFAAFKPDPISDEALMQLHALAQMGPTAFNSQPARFATLRAQGPRLPFLTSATLA